MEDSSWVIVVDGGGEHVHWLLSLVFVVAISCGARYNREKLEYGTVHVLFVWWYNGWEWWQTIGGWWWRVMVSKYSGIHSYWWFCGVSWPSTACPIDDDWGTALWEETFVIGINWWE